LNIVSAGNDGYRPCETNLLAKDGIYIKDYPRSIELFPIPAGGRADIMVRCFTEGSFIVKHFNNEDLLTIESVLPAGQAEIIIAPGPTVGFIWDFPAYLTDLQEELASPGCSCTTAFSGMPHAVNGRQFQKDSYIHTVSYGDVAERTLEGIQHHPYHQHVYPFQIQSGYEDDLTSVNGYWKNGMHVFKLGTFLKLLFV
jgi:hypothetical protein